MGPVWDIYGLMWSCPSPPWYKPSSATQRDGQREKNKRETDTNESKMEVKMAQPVEAPVAKLDDMGSILKTFLVELENPLSRLSSELHPRMRAH